jgi:MFS family permease
MSHETDPRATLTMVLLCLGGLMVSLQQTITIPLMADLPAEIHTAPENAPWLLTASLLSGTISTPVLTRLGDMLGKRRLILVALGALVAGSVLGGLADTFAVVIVARALQGASIVLIPLGLAVMRDELPASRLPLGTAGLSATLAIGAGAGLPLAGILVDGPGWHWVFWTPAMAGGALLVAIALLLPASSVRAGGTVDHLGALLLSLGLSALVLTLSRGHTWGWASPTTLTVAAAGLVALGLFAVRELRVPDPLVDLRLAVRPQLFAAHALSLLLGFAAYANMMITPQLLQQPTSSGYGLGLSTATAGLWLVPMALSFGIFAPLATLSIRHLGAHTTVALGAVLMALTYAARVVLSNDLTEIVIGSVAVSVGTVMTFAALPILVMVDVPAEQTGAANGVNHLVRTIGSVTASAATASLISGMVIRTESGPVVPAYGALAAMFWLAAAACLVSVALLVWLRLRNVVPPEAWEHPLSEATASDKGCV